MPLATSYEGKVRMINEILGKMSTDEKKIMLKSLIKSDMRLFFDAIFEEQKWLEEQTGIDGAELLEDTSAKIWNEDENAGKVTKEAENAYYLDKKRQEKLGNDRFDGFLGYVSDKKSIFDGGKSENLGYVSDGKSTKMEEKDVQE